MVAVARNGKECTRTELVVNGFAWRPLPRAFKLTRFRIQPTRKKHTDHVFLSRACQPLDPACEPLDQACRCRIASTNQEEAHISRVSFKRFVSHCIRLVSHCIRLVVAYIYPTSRTCSTLISSAE